MDIKYFESSVNRILLILLIVFTIFTSIEVNSKSKLISYQSEYEISLGSSETVRLPGKTYVDKASGYLFIDWINNCDNSWVSNQRMMTRFINSHGVGTVNEINYSINEKINGKNMDFLLEVKENAELENRIYGKANLNDSLIVEFPETDKENLNFPGDVVFPHMFLEEIIANLYGDKKMITKKVYEGTIPDKFFNISVFITDKVLKEGDVKLSGKINNKFKQIRMSYYKDNESTPIFEQTVNLNDQGVANYFKYDYPEYSLVLKLKKISPVVLDCN
jgi:hypothetical protein